MSSDDENGFFLIASKEYMYCVPSPDLEVADPSQVKVSQRLNFKCGKKVYEGEVLFTAGFEKAVMEEIQKRRSEKKQIKPTASESGPKGKRPAAVMQRKKMEVMLARKKSAPKPIRKVKNATKVKKSRKAAAALVSSDDDDEEELNSSNEELSESESSELGDTNTKDNAKADVKALEELYESRKKGSTQTDSSKDVNPQASTTDDATKTPKGHKKKSEDNAVNPRGDQKKSDVAKKDEKPTEGEALRGSEPEQGEDKRDGDGRGTPAEAGQSDKEGQSEEEDKSDKEGQSGTSTPEAEKTPKRFKIESTDGSDSGPLDEDEPEPKPKKPKKMKIKRNLQIYEGQNFLYSKDDRKVVKLHEKYDVYVKTKDLDKSIRESRSVTQFIRRMVPLIYTSEALLKATPQGFPPRGKSEGHYGKVLPRLHQDGLDALIDKAVDLEKENKSWRPKTSPQQMKQVFSTRVCSIKKELKERMDQVEAESAR